VELLQIDGHTTQGERCGESVERTHAYTPQNVLEGIRETHGQ